MSNNSTAQQAPGAEQATDKNTAIQAVIDAHNQFSQIFKEDAAAVWQDLIKADYQGSTLNKIPYLNK